MKTLLTPVGTRPQIQFCNLGNSDSVSIGDPIVSSSVHELHEQLNLLRLWPSSAADFASYLADSRTECRDSAHRSLPALSVCLASAKQLLHFVPNHNAHFGLFLESFFVTLDIFI